MMFPTHLTITLVCLLMLASGCTERRSQPADEHSKVTAPQRLGGTWQLEWMGDVDKPTPVLSNTPITLTFAADEKRISGFAGCNRYMGTYTASDHTLRFSAIGSTKMVCAESSVEQQEMNYLQFLQKADKFTFVAGTLLITYDGGAKGLKGPLIINFVS